MRWPAFVSRWRSLSPDAERVICLLAAGATLKAHRSIDGTKIHLLHPLNGSEIGLSMAVVDQLRAYRLIDSNKKFPVATYLLTQRGQQEASALVDATSLPLGSRRF